MSKKPLSSFDLTELLAELQTEKEVTQYRTDGVGDDVLTFMNEFGLKPGQDTINPKTLYRIYKTWSRSPVNAKPFGTRVSEILNSTGARWLFDEASFKLRREDWVFFYSQPKTNTHPQRHGKRHFDAFLSHFGIAAGTEAINFESLVLLYTRFLNETKSKRKYPLLSRKRFAEFCKLYFKEKITAHGNYYFVSETIWKTLSKEIYNEKEKKAKESKKSKKVSIPGAGDEPKNSAGTD